MRPPQPRRYSWSGSIAMSQVRLCLAARPPFRLDDVILNRKPLICSTHPPPLCHGPPPVADRLGNHAYDIGHALDHLVDGVDGNGLRREQIRRQGASRCCKEPGRSKAL